MILIYKGTLFSFWSLGTLEWGFDKQVTFLIETLALQHKKANVSTQAFRWHNTTASLCKDVHNTAEFFFVRFQEYTVHLVRNTDIEHEVCLWIWSPQGIYTSVL